MMDNIKRVLPQFSRICRTHLTVFYDRSQTIRAAVEDVQNTLLIAAVLVVLVIFLFLRKVTATIIPSLALPIALIGTFAGMALMGYSLDNLSLMALTLSVGFVVDDAIVMLENIVRHIEEGEKPYEAAMNGSAEIGFTILSMTLSLAAVFIPIVFMSGIIGRLLHEFAVTIVAAILILGHHFGDTDAHAVRPLPARRAREASTTHSTMERAAFNRVQDAYERTLQWGMAHKPIILGDLRAQPGRQVVHVHDHAADFLPVRRYRPAPGQHAGGRRHLLRADGHYTAAAGGHRPRAIPMSRT